MWWRLARFFSTKTLLTLYKGTNFFISLVFFLLLGLLFTLLISALTSNPYSRFSLVTSPYKTEVVAGDIRVIRNVEPDFSPRSQFSPTHDPFGPIFDWFSTRLTYGRLGLRILISALIPEGKIHGNEQQIIQQIHQERFNPTKPYVITGAHYSDLYVRNLGIFYNALLDPRLPASDEDWVNRQRIAVQTLALDLAYLEHTNEPVTTIVPFNRESFSGIDIYGYPSDSMYSVLYTLDVMVNHDQFPSKTGQIKNWQTEHVGKDMLGDYRLALSRALNHYLVYVMDPTTGLVKKDVVLAGARDGVKRSSSFYDNVIAWQTIRLARRLNVPISLSIDENVMRQKIISTYWQEDKGIFKDDAQNSNFSADSFIVLSTGFLSPDVADDRQKLEKMVAYVQAHKLDDPFPLKYSESNRNVRQQWPVGLFAPSYMAEGIWSHWGMEYIQTLIVLGKTNPTYLNTAEKHLSTYTQNIEKYGGYLELYDKNGKPFRNLFVRSVLHNGWVVKYEQTKLLLDEARNTPN